MRFAPILACLAVTACATAPDPFANTSPLEVDPTDFRAAVALPEGWTVPDGAGVLTLTARQSDLNADVSGAFALQVAQSGPFHVLRFGAEDVAALRALQAQANAWESAAPDATDGEIALTLTACPPAGTTATDPTVSLWIGINGDAPYTQIAEDVALSALAPETPEACP